VARLAQIGTSSDVRALLRRAGSSHQPAIEEMTMMTPEPFLSAEIAYRQQHLTEQYSKGRRRHWVPRRPSLRLPHPRRRPLSVA
jgi:hypothetical protein